MIVHIDCNNFFASCEVADHPELIGKPVVVANANEAGGGIILALSAEAKQLGLKRGNPIFQVKKIIEQQMVTIMPVNHKRYREISKYIMQLVVEQDIVQNFRQYSIDEFFGEIPLDTEAEVKNYITKVKNLITNKTKIPVSCGCSQTYTLAKVATWYAKHYAGYKGVCVLSEANRTKALKNLNITDVWGIGRANSRFLAENGIVFALDFANLPDYYVKHKLGVSGHRTWCELNGQPTIELNKHDNQKSIMHSRTFAFMINDKNKLQELLATFSADVAAKLRAQKSVCGLVTVFLQTNIHRPDLSQYSASDSSKFSTPTQDTALITTFALKILNQIYHPVFQYKKMGIVLSNIVPDSAIQLNLFDTRDIHRSEKLMRTIDEINKRFGDETIHSALANTKLSDNDMINDDINEE